MAKQLSNATLVLISRGYSESEAIDLIQKAQIEFDKLMAEHDYEEAYDVPSSMLGLEPDFIDEFIH